MTNPNPTHCPRCFGPMGRELTVCWPCFRSTDRLTPTPLLLPATIARWDADKVARCAADRNKVEELSFRG